MSLAGALLLVAWPTGAIAAADDTPPDVAAAFGCTDAGEDQPATSGSDACAEAASFGTPRPVHTVNQAYLDGTSTDPLGAVTGWIAVAYDQTGDSIGTVSASEQDGAWVLNGVTRWDEFTEAISSRPEAEFVQIAMTGGAFYAYDGRSLVGLNDEAEKVAPQARAAAAAQAAIIAAYNRSAGSSGLASSISSPIPVVAVLILGAVVISAFWVYVAHDARPKRTGVRPTPTSR